MPVLTKFFKKHENYKSLQLQSDHNLVLFDFACQYLAGVTIKIVHNKKEILLLLFVHP